MKNHQPYKTFTLKPSAMESNYKSPITRFFNSQPDQALNYKKLGIFLVALLSFVISNGQATQPPACSSPSYSTTGTDINVYDSECNDETATISSLIDSNGEEAVVFFFNMKNGSATEEQFPSIVFNNGNTNVDWSLLIAEAELISEENESITTTNITATNITFSGIPTGVNDFGELDNNSEAPDGREYALYIYFNTNTNLADIDGENLVFGLDNTSFPGSSGFSGSGGNGGSASSGGSNNAIDVVATELRYTTFPASSQPDPTTFTVEVEATDENGNRDVDWVDDIDLTKTELTGTFAGTTTVSLSSGLANFPGLSLTPNDTYNIDADDASGGTGDLTNVSSAIVIESTPPTLINEALAQTAPDELEITYQSDETGTLYYVVTTASAAPTQAQIFAGNDDSGTSTNVISSGNSAVTVTGSDQTITLSGLTMASTTYYVHFYEVDGAANESSVVSANTVVDATAPTLINEALAQTDFDELEITYQSNETGTLYYVVTTASAAPTQAQIFAGNDDSGTSTNVISSGNSAVSTTGSDQTITLSGLTMTSTTYYVHFYEADAIGNESSVASANTAVDATAPTLINEALAQTDIDELEITYQSNETGTLYYVVTTASAAPTQAQIFAGNDDSGTSTNVISSGNSAVSTTGSDQTITLSGLTMASTTYYVHFYEADAIGNESSVVSANTVADVTAPTLINQALAQTAPDELEITYQSNETGTLYYVVTTASAAPTQAQIFAGNDDSGTSTNVISSGNAAVTTTGSDQTITLSGLTMVTTTYYVHFYEADAIGNESSVVSANTTTDVTAPTLINEALAQTDFDELEITYQSNETGTLYYVVTTASAAPTQAQIFAGNDDSGTSTNVISSGNTAVTVTGSDQTITLSGLTMTSTTYYVHFYEADAIGNESSVASANTVVDATAPTLINEALAQTDIDELEITYQSNETGTLYWVVTTASATPTAAQIFAGNDDSGTSTNVISSGNTAVTVTGSDQTITLSGLTMASTTYYVHFYEVDAIGNESSIASANTVVDVTAPTLINEALAQTAPDELEITYQSNETGTLHYVVTTSAGTPTQAQIFAGNDDSGTSTNVISSGNSAVTVTGSDQTITLSALTMTETTYYVHFYEVDAIGNESTIATANVLVDLTPPTITEIDLLDTDFDGFIDRIDVVFNDNVDTDDSAVPVIGDFGNLLLPDGIAVTGGTFSDPGGTQNTVQITNITDQVTANTAVGLAEINTMIAGAWVDDVGNAILATGADGETVDDDAAPAIIDVAFYDDSPATPDGFIDRIVLTWSEATSAVDATLSSNEFTGFVTLPDGSAATFGSAVFNGNGTTSMNITGIGGQALQATSTRNIHVTGDPVTFDVEGITTEFTDGSNVTSDPDDTESYTDNAEPVFIDSTPGDGTTSGVGTNIILEFSERIAAGSGNITLTDETNGDDTQVFAVGTGTIDTTTIFFNPADLSNAESYSVQVAATAIEDLATVANVFDGISDNTTFNFNTVATSALVAGDVAFVGFNSDADEFAVVVLVDIFGAITPQQIRFTDEEWSGDDGTFESTQNQDGDIIWTINVNISAGTVVEFTGITGASPAVNPGLGSVAVGEASMALNNSEEAIYAFVGSGLTGVSAVLAGIGTNDNTTAVGDQLLSGSGLTIGSTFIDFDSRDQNLDGASYIGPRAGDNMFSDYLTYIGDADNVSYWSVADGGTSNPAFSLVNFTIDDSDPLVASIDLNTPATSPTNADVIRWDVTFSDLVDGGAAGTSVLNVSNADFEVSGLTGATISVTGSNLAYQVEVSGGDIASFNGAVTLSFAAGQDIADAAGNTLDVGGSTPTPNNATYVLDNTPPTFGTNSISNNNISGFDINVQLNEPGTVYWVVVANGATAPNVAEVIAGTGSGGTGELDAGSIPIGAGFVTETDVATGLASSTMFDVYIVGVDASTNQQAAVTLLDDINAFTNAPDADSDIDFAGPVIGAFDYSTTNNQLTDIVNPFTLGEGQYIGRLRIRDPGSGDNSPTILTDLSLEITGHANIRQIALFERDTDNEIGEITVSGSTANFTGLSFSTADNSQEDVDVYVTFLANVTDNASVSFTVNDDANTATSSVGSSSFGSPITASLSNSNPATITVTATEYRFVQQPTDVTQDVAMSPIVTLEATDALGSRDLNYTENVTITSNGTMTGSVTGGIVLGFGPATSIVHTVNGNNIELTASGALTSATSSQFTVRPLDNDSDAQLVTGGETTDINYAANQQTDLTNVTGVSLAFIDITDAGTQDQVATILTDLQLSIDQNETYLRQLALYDDLGNELDEITVSGTTATFTGMSFSIPDGTTERLTLRGSFTTTVVDNTKVEFSLTSATGTTTGSSNFTGGTVTGTSSTSGTDNQIEVTATQLYFSSIESQSFVNEAFSATIQAVDGNLNLDLDDNSSFNITMVTAPGNISGTTNPTLTNGEVTVSDLAIDAQLSPHTIQASDGAGPLADGTANINITVPDTNTILAASATLDEAIVVVNALNDGISLAAVDVFDFTISDAGTSDAASTFVTDVVIRQGGGNDAVINDWTEVIAGATLTDNALPTPNSYTATAITANTIVFGSMPTTGDIGEIADGTAKTFTLSITTQQTFGGSVATVFDNKFLEFEVDDSDITTAPSGSSLQGVVDINSGGVDTRVIADRLNIFSFPSDIYVDFNFSISVEAVDANGNLDLNESSTVQITSIGASPSPVTSATGVNQSLSGGRYTWTDLQVSVASGANYQFQIDDTAAPLITNVTSGTIATSTPDATSTLARVGGEQSTQIEYVSFQGAVASMTDLNTVEVLTFQVTDASGDGIPTIINSIQVDELSGDFSMLRGVAIFDGSTRLGSVAATGTNNITLSPVISVADGASQTFSVRVSFETTVTDNTQFEFDIAAATQPTTASSTFTSVSATSTTGVNDNTINVTATDVVVTAITDPVIVGANFNPTIEMRDTNGNVDLDFNSTITASVGAGSAATAGIVDTGGSADQVTASNGTATYTGLRIINGGGLHNIDFTDGGTVTGTYTGLLAIYNTSDIVVNNASTPTYIDYIQYDEATNAGVIGFASGESIVVAEFTARDGGASNDDDGLSTFITSIRVDLDADAQDNITALALFDNVGNQIGTQQTVSGGSVTFTPTPTPFEVADGTNETLILKATIDQGANINDGEQMQFSIGQILDNDGGVTESDILDNTPSGIETSLGAGDNTIDVIGDRVIYTVDPGSTTYERNSENINFTVEAQDGNGNLDTDEVSVLNITGSSVLGGTAVILNGTTVTLVGGTSAKTIQIDNEHEDLILTVTDPGPTGSRTGATTISSAGNATLIDIYDRVDPIIVSKATDLDPFDGETDVTIASVNTDGLRMIFSEEVAINPAGGNIVVEGNTSPITEQYILDILTDVTIDPDGDNPLEVELTLPSALTSGVDYYVIIPANTFRDDPNNNVNINGGGGVDDVNDFAGYLADTDWTWTMENVVSIIDATYTPTTITLEFNIPVQISGTAANVVPFFTLTDQGGAGAAQSLVGATLTDGTGGDEFLELNVDLSGALGDVEITYVDPSAGAPDGISEDGNATVELADITAGSGPILNLDNTIPTLFSATEITTSDITLTFSEPVAIDTEIATDFTVEDGQGNTFAVTNWNDATPTDDELELVVTGFGGAVGDLTITYNRTTSRIEDFGGNGLVTGQTATINRDVTIPTFTSIAADAMVDPNRITMNFSEPIQSNGLNLADFVVTDGAAGTYEVFVQVASGSTILLTTADFSGAVGELTVTYNNNNNEVGDFGGNVVPTNSHSIDLDVVAPTLTSVVKNDDVTITATFDESVQILNNNATTSYFSVVDEEGTPFPVTGQSLGASDEIVLTFTDLSTAVGDLLVTYTDPGSLVVDDVIADFSDNGATTVGPLTIDLNYTGTVTLAENALPPMAADDYAEGDTDPNIAMFRTTGTANSSARTPVNITPVIDGSTIRIYSDPALPQGNADLYFEATGVSNTTGIDVRVDEILSSFPTGTDPIDFAGIDDNGIFTFYITEIAPNGVASEGPAVEYSLAFLDEIGNSLGITTFNENENQTVIISLEHPTGQTLTFTGNALQSFMNNEGGTSTINFLVSAAVSGTNQINVSWRSQVSSAEATFEPSELAFEINQSVDVFATTDPSDRSFGRNNASSLLNLNTTIGDRDIDGAETADLDFYTLEAYFVRNGAVLTVGSDGMGGTPAVGTTGVISAGGNIASDVLIYDGAGSAGGVNGRPTIDPLGVAINNASTFITGEWEINPTGLSSSITNLFTSENRVDTIRLYTITRDDDLVTPSYGQISNDEIYLYPDPSIFYTNLSAIYCQDEDLLTIQARIFTYNGTGGIDSTGFIQNGYLLEYSADGSFATPTQVNFSNAAINSVPAGVLSNEFDPGDPLQDGSNVTGFFRIYYNSLPHTAANTVGQEVFQFEVRPKVSAPVLNEAGCTDCNGALDDSGGLQDNGTPGDTSDDFYMYEYCSGETIPFIPIDVSTTGADANPNLNPDEAFRWYFSNGTLIEQDTSVLDPALVFSSNPPFGTLTADLYVSRIVDGCESDSIPITIRVFDIPPAPPISLTETVDNDSSGDPADDGNIGSDGNDYYFEYCGAASATITFDDLVIATSLEDVPADRSFVENRTYFNIYEITNNGNDTTLIERITNSGVGASSYSIDLNGDPSLTIDDSIVKQASTTPNGFEIREFYISKVVADGTFTDGGMISAFNPDFAGCESDFTKITVGIYTFPEVPDPDLFTGNPRIDGGVVNYYMCASEEFPEIGVDPPATATNGEAEFEWFNNSDATGELVEITNRRGEVITEADLENVANGTGFDSTVPGTYIFYVRFRSNINDNSDFVGCESGLRQVNLTVFPQSLVPSVSTDLSNVTNATVEVADPDPGAIGNFDVEYNFCVEGFVGLDGMTEFESFINFPGSPTSGENEVLWFAANEDGDAITGTNPIAEGNDDADPGRTFTVNAADLQIQSSENDIFNFAVIHRADFFTGYEGFNGCFSNSVDTTYVRVIVSTTPEPQFSFSGITAGEGVNGAGTMFNFIDETSIGTDVDFIFEITDVDNGGTLVTSTSGTGDLSASDEDFQYQFTAAGTYEGRLQITSSAGCQVETIRRFVILDKIIVTESYGEGFESLDAGGWFAEFQSDDGLSGSINDVARVTSWTHGSPSGDNITTTRAGAGSAWTTTGTALGSTIPNNYVGGEVSYVYSPAFDLSSLTNPAIRFSTYRDLDGTKDGVVLQFSVDDGINWATLGSYDITNEGSPSSGQNWYNESAISTSPGDGGINVGTGFNTRRDGWAGQYTAEELNDVGLVNGWFESTHELDETLPTLDAFGNDLRENVRFRFALSSSGAIADNKIGDGFGFDDMQIFQLGKNVLVEQFSSTVSVPSIIVGAEVNNTLGADPLMINYFTSVGNTEDSIDELNERNSTSPGARRAFYGIGEVPTTVLDGEVIAPDKSVINNNEVITGQGWDDNDISIKGLAPALFTMPLGVNGVRQDASDAGTIAVTARFDFAFDDSTFVDKDYSFIFAVVETQVDGTGIGSYPDGTIIRNVLRVLLPTPAGFNYKGDVVGDNSSTTGTDESQFFEYSVEWDINNVYDADELRVIAFAQDNATKEILQAGWVDITGASETILGIDGISDFSVYPNPADDEVTVEFVEASRVESEWILFDQAGREVFKGTLSKGSKSLSIKTSDIPSGLYFFNLYSEDQGSRARRIIVTH